VHGSRPEGSKSARERFLRGVPVEVVEFQPLDRGSDRLGVQAERLQRRYLGGQRSHVNLMAASAKLEERRRDRIEVASRRRV
jgi:hypothetical protein